MSTELSDTATVVQCGSRQLHWVLVVHSFILNILHCISITAMQSALNQYNVQLFTESDDTRCCVNTICPLEDGHVNGRNMSRIVV